MTFPLFEETLRQRFRHRFPGVQFSFEPGDIVGRIMNFGAPTPVQVAVAGPDFQATRAYVAKLRGELGRVPTLRDLHVEQALDYPAIEVNVDRERAGQLGVSVEQIGRSFAAATSSSRFVAPNYWADPRTGIAFQVQVEVPQPQMKTLEDLRVVPVTAGGAPHALLGDVARVESGTVVGEYDRFNGQRMVTLSANTAGEDLGRDCEPRRRGDRASGCTASRRDRVGSRPDRADARDVPKHRAPAWPWPSGVIFLLLAANFQSARLALAVVSTAPAALAGVVVMLALTRTTINVQSFMGAIMAVGVAVANAILLVTYAEQSRRRGGTAMDAAIAAAQSPAASRADDQRGDDRRHDADGARHRRGERRHGAPRPRRDRRACGRDVRDGLHPAVRLLVRAAVRRRGVGLARPRRSG